MVVAALLACTLALALPPGDDVRSSIATLTAPTARVRGTDSRTREWLWAGASGSETFRSLLARLADSDVIVYVMTVDRIYGGAEGQTYFVTATPTVRYLRIEVVAEGNLNARVALLGHELQHAVEIANAAHVRDRHSLAMLYLAMSENAFSGSSQFDSAAARQTGDRVRRELAGRRPVATSSW